MEEKHLLQTEEIDENDWQQTPVSVRNLVLKLLELLGNKLKILETLVWQAFDRFSTMIAET